MLPVYRFMDSYPQSSPHYPQYYYPNWEANPPQMKLDPSKSPISYQPWPHGCSHGYSVPVGCHGCCNHGYAPGPGYCSFRPPYIHFPSSSPIYHHGAYPPYPESYPACFVHPHYSMEQPRYEYDKNNFPKNHCCGCPNHKSNWKEEDKKVVIKEQDPDVDKRDGKSSGSMKFRDYPYPIMWIPSDYMNKESNGVSESEPKMKPSESKKFLDQDDSNVRCGWFPIDLESFKSLMQGGEKNKIQQEEHQKAHSPGQNEHKKIQYPHSEEDLPCNFKNVSERLSDNHENGDKPVGVDNSGGEVHLKKDSRFKSIPVKQIEECRERISGETENKSKIITVKKIEEVEKSPDSPRKQSSSSQKASKLPPICLRIDPLPKKKNGSGTLRSSSPPRHKAKMQENSNGTPPTSSEMGPKEKESVADEVYERTEDQKKKGDVQIGDRTSIPSSVPIVSHEEQMEAKQKLPQEAIEERKKELLPTEAAVIIQSAYRGFEVRKWEPLNKLKQLTKIQQQVEGLRNRLHDLESIAELRNDEKQRVVIGETIMNLLLQLDTIQGLHPSLRDMRKLAARELTRLQEKLDSLTSLKSEELDEEVLPVKPVEDEQKEPENDENDNENMQVEPSYDQHLYLGKVAEPQLIEKDAWADIGVESLESPMEKGEEPEAKVTELVKKPEDDMNEESAVKPEETAKTQKSCHETESIMERSGEAPLVTDETNECEQEPHAGSSLTNELHPELEVNNNVTEVCDSLLMDKDVEVNCAEEPPQGVVDEDSNSRNRYGLQDGGAKSNEAEVKSEPEAEAPKMDDPMHLSIGDTGKESSEQDKEDILTDGGDAGIEPDEVLAKSSEQDKEDILTDGGDVGIEPDEVLAMPPGNEGGQDDQHAEVFKPEEEPGAGSEPDELLVLPPGNEDSQDDQLGEVLKPEAPVPVPSLLVDDGHMEELSEVYQISNVMAPREEMEMELPCEEANEGDTEKPLAAIEVPRVEDMMAELHKEEKKEFGESETAEEEEVAVITSIDSAPVSVDSAEEERQDLRHESNFGGARAMLIEENEKLREMLEKLIQAGKEQLYVISDLNGRVGDLERKLTKKKKLRMRKHQKR